MEKLKFKKKLKIKKIVAALVLFFAKKLLIIFFLQMISCTNYIFMFIMKSSISTMSQKFSIKTLIRIGYLNFKNEQKACQNSLGVKQINKLKV